jgi:hypothetical protein
MSWERGAGSGERGATEIALRFPQRAFQSRQRGAGGRDPKTDNPT